jgi:2-(1,2-epoxy-1,2-dihydrophenyl)acetyl-CoA isomerase
MTAGEHDRANAPDAQGPGTTTNAGGIAVSRSGATATVRMIGRRGALDVATKRALRAALERLGEDAAVRAVVLTGTGDVFCLGQDLREHAAALDADATAAWETLRDHYNPIVESIMTMPKPVIAAVNGVAAGAGASFAFACDLRVVAELASFHLAFAGVGLSLDSGMSWTLPRLVGHAKATELVLRGGRIDAASALGLGLAHEVVAAADLDAHVARLATDLSAGPTIAFGAAKEAIAYAAGHGLADTLEMEAALQTVAGTTSDHRAAVAAFLQKRTPTFGGN